MMGAEKKRPERRLFPRTMAEAVSAGLELQMVSCGNTFVASTCFFATSLFHQVS